MSGLHKIKDTEENKAFWKHLEENAERVKHWPTWAGGEGKEPICCPTCNQPLPKKEGI
jgi:hypothetical protein